MENDRRHQTLPIDHTTFNPTDSQSRLSNYNVSLPRPNPNLAPIIALHRFRARIRHTFPSPSDDIPSAAQRVLTVDVGVSRARRAVRAVPGYTDGIEAIVLEAVTRAGRCVASKVARAGTASIIVDAFAVGKAAATLAVSGKAGGGESDEEESDKLHFEELGFGRLANFW